MAGVVTARGAEEEEEEEEEARAHIAELVRRAAEDERLRRHEGNGQ